MRGPAAGTRAGGVECTSQLVQNSWRGRPAPCTIRQTINVHTTLENGPEMLIVRSVESEISQTATQQPSPRPRPPLPRERALLRKNLGLTRVRPLQSLSLYVRPWTTDGRGRWTVVDAGMGYPSRPVTVYCAHTKQQK